MGLTYSFITPHTHHKQHRYEYAPKLIKQLKKHNNYKKSRIISTELINPIESTSILSMPITNIDEGRQTITVFECHVEKVNN